MFSALFSTQTRYVVIILAATMAPHAANAATAMTTIICRGKIMQSACKQSDICINDPIRLSNELPLSLSLKKRTYSTLDVMGEIVSIGAVQGRRLNLTIDPAIRGGTQIVFSSNGRRAKLVGGDYNYFFDCQKANR